MTAFDNDLMFRTSGNLTQSESSGAIKLRSTPVHGMAVRVNVPSSTGTTNTLLPRVLVSDTDAAGSYTLAAQYEGGAQQVADAGSDEFIVPFATSKKYVKLELVIAGSTGTPNYGAVVAGLVLQAGYDWSRSVDFS